MSASHPPVSAPVAPGDVLAGKFEVERVLGAGGMGVVVAARHLELDERVAVKFLHPEHMLSGEAGARFVREARAAVKIKSEHVARVIDVGRLENGAPYIVMEYLQGNDLSAQIAKGTIAIEDAVDYVIQACDAMAEAHALGIVHRDLKPANLFLTSRSDGGAVVKVLDFGISKLQVPDMKDAGLTKTSAVMGSPYYMSPEQMKSSRDVDLRTDVWSLGVILFELIAGRPPFQGETLPALLAAIMMEQPPLLQSLRPEVPAELSAAMSRALQKDRQLRFQNVGELAAALSPFAPRRTRHTLERVLKLSGGGAARPSYSDAPVGGTVVMPAEARTASAWADTGKTPGKSSRAPLFIGLGVVALAAAAAGTVWALRTPPAASDAAAAPVPSAPTLAVEPRSETAAPAAIAAQAPAPLPKAAEPAAPTPAAAVAAPIAAKPAAAPARGQPAKAAPEKPAAAPPPPEPSPLVPPPAKPEPTPAAAPARRPGLQIDLK